MSDDLEEALRLSRESYERERAQLPAAPQITIHNDEQEGQHGPPPPYSEVDPYHRQPQSQSQPQAQPPLHPQSNFRPPAPPVSQLTLNTQPPRHPDRLPSPTLPPRRPVSPRLPARPSVSSSTFPGKANATHGNIQGPDNEIRPALPQRRY